MAALLALAAAVCLHLWHNPPPRPHYIYVNQTADHAHDTAQKLSLKLAERRSGAENALVFLARLPPGEAIEQTATRLFESLAIGRRTGGKGILILYSAAENRLKIEVSYALEGSLPDAVCRRLEEAARTFMLSEQPQDFVSELLITLNRAQVDAAGFEAPAWTAGAHLAGGAGVTTKGYELGDYAAAVSRLPADGLAAYAPGATPEATLAAYLKSLENGLGEPQLPLLTPGSRVFRLVTPRNRAQQRRVFDYYAKASPPALRAVGDLALAVFKPGVPNLPVVLRRLDGRWYVDEPKAWTWFHRFEDGDDFFPKFDDLPFLPFLRELKHPTAERVVFDRRVPTPPPFPAPERLAAEIAARERAHQFRAAGELYLFELDWLTKARAAFEAARAQDPDDLAVRWRLFDAYVNLSEDDNALAELRFLAKKLPRDAVVQEWNRFYAKAFAFAPGEF